MKINTFLSKTRISHGWGGHAPRAYLRDGESVSIQTGRYLYCRPRGERGPWSRVELGFPSFTDHEFMEFCDDHEKPLDTVYGYVPVELAERVFAKHGGIDMVSTRIALALYTAWRWWRNHVRIPRSYPVTT